MRRTKIGGLVMFASVLSLTAATISAQSPADRITASPVSYADLGKLVRSQRGKVVVVDVWSLG